MANFIVIDNYEKNNLKHNYLVANLQNHNIFYYEWMLDVSYSNIANNFKIFLESKVKDDSFFLIGYGAGCLLTSLASEILKDKLKVSFLIAPCLTAQGITNKYRSFPKLAKVISKDKQITVLFTSNQTNIEYQKTITKLAEDKRLTYNIPILGTKIEELVSQKQILAAIRSYVDNYS